MKYIYAVIYVSYVGGTIRQSIDAAYTDKEKAIERARFFNEQYADQQMADAKVHKISSIDHYFVETIKLYQ